MAKKIKIDIGDIEACKKEFEEMLGKLKMDSGKVKFEKEFGTIEGETTVYFEEDAWQKMQALVREFSSEIAWHGIAERYGDDYLIRDILVYPQEVTGATVTTDQVEYQNWLYSFDDEIFDNIRFQGHSHVNMGASPSTTDTNLYENILSQMGNDAFYIFLITNKSGSIWAKVYDMSKNLMYDNKDVEVKVLMDEGGIEEFVSKAKELVTKPGDKKKTKTEVVEEDDDEATSYYDWLERYSRGDIYDFNDDDDDDDDPGYLHGFGKGSKSKYRRLYI